jgi:hypothetical protein
LNGRKLIGLAGYATAGKDAAASGLVSIGWERVAFADAIRELLLKINPIIGFIGGGPIYLAQYIEDHGWDAAKKSPEVRNLLQKLGGEAREVLGQNVWSDLVTRKILNSRKSVVVADVRLPREVAIIRGMGGVVVRISRPGVGPINDHDTDAHIDKLNCQFDITNNSTEADLKLRLQEIASSIKPSKPLAA